MKILFLDDEMDRHDEFRKKCPPAYHFYTASFCIGALSTWAFDIVCLDHDLEFGDHKNAGSGMDVVEYIENNEVKGNPIFIIHSFNEIKAEMMNLRLLRAGKRSRCVWFGPDLFEVVNFIVQRSL